MADILVSILTVLVQVFLIALAADFLGGLFHWAEDTLGDVTTPIWGPTFALPNTVHHDRPADILKVPWLRGARFVIAAGVAILLVVLLFGALTWQWLLFVGIAALNDQAHRWEHTPPYRLPRFVHWLRHAHVLQSARHHWQHHKPPHTIHYCVLTPWLNPLLDRSHFWRGMERVFVPVFGAPRRPDLARK